MNKSEQTSLIQLYRVHAQNDAPLPAADTLVSLALGDRPIGIAGDAIEQVAASPLNGKLLHLARDLQPLSIDLGMDLEALLGRPARAGSHRQTHVRRAFGAQPRWRVAAAAMAASLIAVAGLWTAHRLLPSTGATPAVVAQSRAAPDRIFAGFNDKAVATRGAKRGDEIFRGRFLPDEIFSSRGHEG
ncbi:MAG: hypothetical protein WBV39_02375 [Rudaea sp.]